MQYFFFLDCIHQYFCKHFGCHLNIQGKGLQNDLVQLFSIYELSIDILVHMDLIHKINYINNIIIIFILFVD